MFRPPGSEAEHQGDLVGATQLEDEAGAGAVEALAVAAVVGATQFAGADADAVVFGADAGVDCNLASRWDDAVPSGGIPFACSNSEIAAWVR